MPSRIRVRIEESFAAWGRFVARNPIAVLAASLALVGLCAAGLPRVEVDVSFEAFLGKHDPILADYDRFRERFGRDDRILIAVDPGPEATTGDVFEPRFLARLRALHEAIERRIPYVVEVTSLVNARDTRARGDTLIVSDLLDPWPVDREDLARVRARALANPLFRDRVISANGRLTTLSIELQLYSSRTIAETAAPAGADSELLAGFAEAAPGFRGPPQLLTASEAGELVGALYTLLDEFEEPGFRLHLAGSPVVLSEVSDAMMREMPRFFGLAVLSIGVLLFLLFRRVFAVLVPLGVVSLSVLGTLGWMGWVGTPIHVPTQLLPSFLLAVGIGDAVHLLTIFFERLRRGDGREQALEQALRHAGLPLVLTSLTTAVGLASFIGSGMAPVAAIGIFAPIGVLIALGLSLTLLPAAMIACRLGELDARAARPLGGVRESSGPDSPAARQALHDGRAAAGFDRVLIGLGVFATRHARAVVGGALGLAILATGCALRLGLSHDPLSWLRESTRVVQATRFIDEELGGAMSFEVFLDTGVAGGAKQPDTLQRMADYAEDLERRSRDGLRAAQTVSLADLVKETHRALNADRPEAYRIPDDPNLVAQELLLFEQAGRDDLEKWTDPEYRRARIAVQMPWRDAVRYGVFLELARDSMTQMLEPVGSVTQTGLLALLARAVSTVVHTMAQSYLIAFAIITPIMVFALGSLRWGLWAMLPNLLPVLLTLGWMGAAKLPLDGFTLMVGGIALGVAVDDTIHFMHHYVRGRSRGLAFEAAVRETLRTTGRAMLITTLALSAGFLVFSLSSMQNLRNLGLLVSFAITAAFFSDVLLMPALLSLLERPSARGHQTAPTSASYDTGPAGGRGRAADTAGCSATRVSTRPDRGLLLGFSSHHSRVPTSIEW